MNNLIQSRTSLMRLKPLRLITLFSMYLIYFIQTLSYMLLKYTNSDSLLRKFGYSIDFVWDRVLNFRISNFPNMATCIVVYLDVVSLILLIILIQHLYNRFKSKTIILVNYEYTLIVIWLSIWLIDYYFSRMFNPIF